MVRSASKSGHQKGIMCLQDTGLRAQNISILVVIGSIVNTIGWRGTYMTIQRSRQDSFTFGFD